MVGAGAPRWPSRRFIHSKHRRPTMCPRRRWSNLRSGPPPEAYLRRYGATWSSRITLVSVVPGPVTDDRRLPGRPILPIAQDDAPEDWWPGSKARPTVATGSSVPRTCRDPGGRCALDLTVTPIRMPGDRVTIRQIMRSADAPVYAPDGEQGRPRLEPGEQPGPRSRSCWCCHPYPSSSGASGHRSPTLNGWTEHTFGERCWPSWWSSPANTPLSMRSGTRLPSRSATRSWRVGPTQARMPGWKWHGSSSWKWNADRTDPRCKPGSPDLDTAHGYEVLPSGDERSSFRHGRHGRTLRLCVRYAVGGR